MSLVDSSAGTVTAGTIPSAGVNNALAPIFGAGTTTGYGYFGASVQGSAGSYLIEYFGAEASNNNQFAANGSVFASASAASVGDTSIAATNSAAIAAANNRDAR